MKKGMIAVIAALLISGGAIAQDDVKKASRTVHKEMKQEATHIKKDARKEGNAAKADAAKGMKHTHKSVKKVEKKVSENR